AVEDPGGGRKMKSSTLRGRVDNTSRRTILKAVSPTARPPTVQELKSILSLLRKFRNLHRKLGGKCGIWMAWWTAQLADAAIVYITDLKVTSAVDAGMSQPVGLNGGGSGSGSKAQAPQSTRSVARLMAAMERDPHAAALKEFVMMKAILHGVAGKVLRDEALLTVSRQLFAQFGSAFFLQWVLGPVW
ncbi:hypothetical protein HK101_010299, partial [Irineochytrium annulatum]